MMVRYEATVGDHPFGGAEVYLYGVADIPDEMWARREPAHRWSREIADLIRAGMMDYPAQGVCFERREVWFLNIDPIDFEYGREIAQRWEAARQHWLDNVACDS